jgi:hypothetical protein
MHPMQAMGKSLNGHRNEEDMIGSGPYTMLAALGNLEMFPCLMKFAMFTGGFLNRFTLTNGPLRAFDRRFRCRRQHPFWCGAVN